MAAPRTVYAPILRGIGAPVTPTTTRDLAAWQRAEGGSATYNPFNTTFGGFGGTNYNSVGVKNYPTARAGIQATINTLLNGRYGNLVRGLRAGGAPARFASDLGASPWGTNGNLVAKILNTPYSTGSSKGRTLGSEPSNVGSTPTPVAPGNFLSNFLFRNSQSLLGGGYGQSPIGLEKGLASLQSLPNAPRPSTGVTRAPRPSMVSGTKGAELYLPADFKATHDTAGLSGFPAIDNFAAAGTPVLAPVGGKLVYVHNIPWNQAKHVGGTTAYLQGVNGKTYFLTHLAGNVPTGNVTAGQNIGSVAAVPNGWWPTHVHEGVYNGIYNPPGA